MEITTPPDPLLLPTNASCSRCGKVFPGKPMAAGPLRDAVLKFAKRIVCLDCQAIIREEERQQAQAAALVEAAGVRADPAGALRHCGVGQRWWGAGLDACPDLPAELVGLARQWAADPQGFLLFCGITGCGKTWLAVAIMLEVMRLGIRRPIECRAFTELEFEKGLKRAMDDPREGDVERGEHVAARVPLLLYDDLGSRRLNDWRRDEITGLFEVRHSRCLPTIVTSNLDPEEIASQVDPRTASRLRESGSGAIMFPARDLRLAKGD
jgi:hypothetical protein